MTKALESRKVAFNIQEVLEYFRASNYEDCRINAYPSFTKYDGINRTAPSFLMIDINLKDFASKDKLVRAMNRDFLKRIETIMHGHPTVLWTGNGYHIYQPMDGFIFGRGRHRKILDPNGKDHTSKFMQFAEDFLTNKKEEILNVTQL